MKIKDGISIEIIGDKAGLSRLKKASTDYRRPKRMFEEISIYLEGSTGKTFKMEGRPKWPQSQRAKERGGPTLQKEKQLFASVTGRAADSIRKISDKVLVFGTSLKHGAVHQFGSSKRNLPARPFLGVYKEDEKKIEQIMERWGEKVVRGGS